MDRKKIIIIAAIGLFAVTAAVYGLLPKGISDLKLTDDKGASIDSIQLDAGETTKISYEIEPDAFADRTPEFTVADTSVATVDESGVVEGVSEGTTMLIAKAMSCTVRVEVTVKVQISDIEGVEDVTLTEGDTSQLEPEIKAEGADEKTIAGYDISYKSSDTAVAKVDDSGLITAVAPGTAKITLSVKGFEKKISVTVNEKPVVVVRPKSSSGGSSKKSGGGNSGGGGSSSGGSSSGGSSGGDDSGGEWE